MRFHMHTIRSFCGAALGLILAVTLLGAADRRAPAEFERAPVTGHITCGGHPLYGMSIMFQQIDPGDWMASGTLGPDGSFRMQPWNRFDCEGLVTGTYRVYLLPYVGGATASSVDLRYRNPRTSGLLVHVGPGWNDVSISLPAPGRGPTLAQYH
jgi:hypothetical protein